MCKYCKNDLEFSNDNNYQCIPGLSVKSSSRIFGYSIMTENDASYMSKSDYHYAVVEDMDIFPKHKKTIMFNSIKYCPFCGKKLSDVYKDKKYYMVIDNHKDEFLRLEITPNAKIIKEKFEYCKAIESTHHLLILEIPAKHVVDLFNKYFLKHYFIDSSMIKYRNIDSFIEELNKLYNAEIVIDNRSLFYEMIK